MYEVIDNSYKDRHYKQTSDDDFSRDGNTRLSDVVFNEDGVSEPVKMLRGVFWEEVFHDTFTYREMTGEDEEAISKSDIRANGAKVIHTLLARCVKSIGTLTRKELGNLKWEALIRSLYVGDQDFMLIAIRAASLGKEFDIPHNCPECGVKLRSYVNVDELKIEPFKGLDKIPFSLKRGFRDHKGNLHTEGVLRLSCGEDREVLAQLYRKNPGVAKTVMLTRLTKFNGDDAPPMNDKIMRSLTTGDRKTLSDLLADNEFGIDGRVDLTCTACGFEFTGDLSGANFMS